jgi:hypothetical protein
MALTDGTRLDPELEKFVKMRPDLFGMPPDAGFAKLEEEVALAAFRLRCMERLRRSYRAQAMHTAKPGHFGFQPATKPAPTPAPVEWVSKPLSEISDEELSQFLE